MKVRMVVVVLYEDNKHHNPHWALIFAPILPKVINCPVHHLHTMTMTTMIDVVQNVTSTTFWCKQKFKYICVLKLMKMNIIWISDFYHDFIMTMMMTMSFLFGWKNKGLLGFVETSWSTDFNCPQHGRSSIGSQTLCKYGSSLTIPMITIMTIATFKPVEQLV